ncbi:MAG: preprotein translocase subunit SecA [Tenericutes bacterium]|nr:preprotein translocase subunit SecA [Mycoplasmatota bacterium]
MGLLKRLVDTEYKELKRFNKIADEIEALDETYSKMSDEELKGKTAEFRERLAKGETLEDIKVEAFATAREAAYRMIGEKPYRVQLIGGLAIHYGNIAEMKTGEGKTLTTILPAYLNALPGKGVHVVTVNEYLSDRNAKWMGPIYDFLGITVGVNLRELTPSQKRDVYNCDITYSTNNEIGFDYLRDNMVTKKEDRTQRGLNYCIIDEVDSILIDEARTPLIISGGKMNSANLYMDADRAVKRLIAEEDYIIDEKAKSVILTEKGSIKVQTYFKLANLYDAENTALVHHINQALKANFGMKKDVDYVVDDEGNVVIVDQFTGRLMHGRQFSEGLHQAIEAKEGVKINEETKTLATITFQNLFRMYNKISGMTGTAKTEEEEFRDIYNMYVIEIPTNKPCIREDMADMMFATEKGKYDAIVKFIEEVHATGEPILVGTISVESNERLSKMLTKAKLPHEVLNAKNHLREAEIIAKAGEKGAITIATNMAGRGTDIKLGEGVKELGGLCVLGTERHESRRIDNQLRGRAGRQGDPGYSQFFISFEDELMRRFGTDKIKTMIQSVGYDETQPIRSKMFSKSVETAQKKVEGNNYDMRKTLLDYDNIVSEQRKIIYEKRNEILDTDDIHSLIIEIFKDYVFEFVDSHMAPEGYLTENDLKAIENNFNTILKNQKLDLSNYKDKKEQETIDYVTEIVIKDYEEKIKDVPKEMLEDFERYIALRVIDDAWVEHINSMEHLKEGIGLRGYAQTNPLQAYALEGYDIFDKMQDNIDANIVNFLLKLNVNINRKPVQKGIANDGKETLKKEPATNKKKKIGRNDLCPCGSGKKYKQCCGK